ncbi:MAG: hypothetical protein Q7S84_00335 [bacterium]|nr:hypothetical protein [bacterium]
MNRIISLLLALMLVLVTSVMAQISERPAVLTEKDSLYLEQFRGMVNPIPTVWVDVKTLNWEHFPKPDLVYPGQVIDLPLGMTYRAQQGGTDHMWKGSQKFIDQVVLPYTNGRYNPKSIEAPIVRQKPDSSTMRYEVSAADTPAWFLWVVMTVFVLAMLFILWKVVLRDKIFPSFVKSSPDRYRHQFTTEAQRMVTEAFGAGTKIAGEIVYGVINGHQWMLHKNGKWLKHEFKKEKGFKAVVEFSNGSKRVVYCCEKCFNPVFGDINDVREFKGTFVPADVGPAEVIPAMAYSQRRSLQMMIANGTQNEEAILATLPEVPKQEVRATAVPVTMEPKVEQPASEANTEDVMEVSNFQFSLDKGLTVTGAKVTPKVLMGLMTHAARLMRPPTPRAKKAAGVEEKK